MIEKYVQVGGKDVTRLVVGTSRVAADKLPNGEFVSRYDQEEWEIELLRYALRSGLTFIDTARAYGGAEVVIGKAIQGFDRTRLAIATKVGYRTLEGDELRRQIDESCERLGTVPDIVFLHDRREGQMDDALPGALVELDLAVQRGAAILLGISNFRPEELKRAISLSDGGIAAYQARVNIVNPRPDAESLRKVCQEEQILFMASSALNRGNMTIHRQTTEFEEIMRKYGLNEMQLALLAVLASGLLPIYQSHSQEHIDQNSAVLDIKIDQADCERLQIRAVALSS